MSRSLIRGSLAVLVLVAGACTSPTAPTSRRAFSASAASRTLYPSDTCRSGWMDSTGRCT